MPKTDAALLNLWSDLRDAEAFTELISRHATMVHGTCLRLLRNVSDAEDITQECFLKLSRKQDIGSSHVGGWLHRVATNSCLDRLRVDLRRERRDKAYVERSQPVQEQTWNDIKRFVDEAIASLPDDLRGPLVLHFLEARTHKATAAALGLTRSTTTRRIHRGIDQIREHLRSKGLEVSAMTFAILLEANTAQAVPLSLMSELRKIALTGSRAPSKEILARPGSASRGIWLMGTGLVVLALIVGGVTITSRSASGSSEPGNVPPPPSFSATPAALSVESSTLVPPKEPAPVEAALAAQAPMKIAQALDEPEDPLLLRCVDTNGDPIEGAEVYLVHLKINTPGMRMPTSAEERRTTAYGPYLSDHDGFASLPHIEEPDDSAPYNITDHYTAYARLPGQRVGAWSYVSSGRSEPDWNHIVLVESMQIEGTVFLPAGFKPADVSVRVLTLAIQDGKTRFGASFSASSKLLPPHWPDLFEATPDDSGRFVLKDIPKSGRYYLAATAAGLGEKQFFSLNPESDTEIEMQLEPEGMIEGTLRYAPSGAPVNDVPVLARPSGRYQGRATGITSSFVTRTDSMGRFRFTGLPTESYNVYTYPLGNPHEWVAPVTEDIVAEAGFITKAVDLWFERGVIVEGQVRDEVSGEPIADVMIVAMNPGGREVGRGESLGSVMTDADGRYRMLVPREGTGFYFAAIPAGYARPSDQGRTPLNALPGESRKAGFDFTLRADPKAGQPIGYATVKGRVLDLDGNPLKGVEIRDQREYDRGEARSVTMSISTKSGADGRFSFKVMAIGKHRIHFGGKGHSLTESELLAPKEDDIIELPDTQVVLFTKVLSGTLTDAAGTLLSGIHLYLASDDDGWRETESDRNGEFKFEHVPDGMLRLSHHVAFRNPLYKDFFKEVEGGFHYTIVLSYIDEPDEEP